MVLREIFLPFGSEGQDRRRGSARVVESKGGRLAERAGGLVVHRDGERLVRSADERVLIGGRVGQSCGGCSRRIYQRVQPDEGHPKQQKERSSQAGCFHIVLTRLAAWPLDSKRR
jgi:hypothetical protein